MAANLQIVAADSSANSGTEKFSGWLHPHEKYRVSVGEYTAFHRDGFLVVRNLLSQTEVQHLLDHTEDLMDGKVVVPGVEPPGPGLSRAERAQYYLRIHMLHRVMAIHEQYLLHPRVLDVLEALIGPDVLALQTMLFLKGPGKPGQGYHQDSYYIPTAPDTLIGAWIALDPADTLNGCLWMTMGSQHEPVYPPYPEQGLPPTSLRGPFGNQNLSDITPVAGVSDPDEEKNDLTRVARKYHGREVPVILEPGDVAFFGGHVLHRSLSNVTTDRFRRSFVGHYCNARSYTEWGGGNQAHILARGDTHLPFAKPKFGTPCAALLPPEERRQLSPVGSSMMGGPDGMMGMEPHGDEHSH